MADSSDDLVRLLRPVITVIFAAHRTSPEEGEALIEELLRTLRAKRESIANPAAWFVKALHEAVVQQRLQKGPTRHE